MHYQVSRNGQTYGPYTLEDLQRYLASGNVLPTDLAKSEEMADWLPVAQILAAEAPAPAAGLPPSEFSSPGYANPAYTATAYTDPAYTPAISPAAALANSPYQDAPNLHWGLVLLFGFLTCTFFMLIWNIIVAAWLKRVQPNATSLYLYIGFAVLTVLQFAVFLPSTMHSFGPHVHGTYSPIGSLVGLIAWVVKLIARFMQRASLQEHFNTVEPIGLQLNPVMTFFFGGIYFQYHLNRINEMKQAARYGSGRVL